MRLLSFSFLNANKPALTDPLLILISLPVKGEFILNCEWTRGGALIYLYSARSLDVIWQQIIWWALLRHEEYCYSVGRIGKGWLFTINDWRLYRRCTKLPTDIQTNTISGATCFPITVTGMSLFAQQFRFFFLNQYANVWNNFSEWMTKHLHLEIDCANMVFGLLIAEANKNRSLAKIFFWFLALDCYNYNDNF